MHDTVVKLHVATGLLLNVSHFRRNLLFHFSPFDLFRRRSHRVEEGRRQGHDAPDADDEEEAEVAVALLDLLAHCCNLRDVIGIFQIYTINLFYINFKTEL